MNIHGVTEGVVRSYGNLTISLSFDKCVVDNELNVVPSSFPIPADGILGKDFLLRFSCRINYEDMLFQINSLHNIRISVPIYVEDLKASQILPRCEIFHNFAFEKPVTDSIRKLRTVYLLQDHWCHLIIPLSEY